MKEKKDGADRQQLGSLFTACVFPVLLLKLYPFLLLYLFPKLCVSIAGITSKLFIKMFLVP